MIRLEDFAYVVRRLDATSPLRGPLPGCFRMSFHNTPLDERVIVRCCYRAARQVNKQERDAARLSAVRIAHALRETRPDDGDE